MPRSFGRCPSCLPAVAAGAVDHEAIEVGVEPVAADEAEGEGSEVVGLGAVTCPQRLQARWTCAGIALEW